MSTTFQAQAAARSEYSFFEEEAIHSFKKTIRFFFYFHLFFIFILLTELSCFAVFFPFLRDSYWMAFALAFLFLTGFSYTFLLSITTL